MQGILSKELILQVEKESQNPFYKKPGILSFVVTNNNPLFIMKITPKGLIFIHGTNETGFKHIYQRHSGYSKIDYWDNFYDNNGNVILKVDNFGRKKLRLDNPSNFHPNTIPIHEYPKIADQIFNPKNINTAGNKKKDLFDIYNGIAFDTEGNKIKYRLITYKDSKIVHTLIPLTKDYNRQPKRIINFARQNPKSILSLSKDEFKIEVPYIDEFNIVRYIIIIRNHPKDSSKEKWYIQVNSPNGTPILTNYFGSREKDSDILSEDYLLRLEYINFTSIEKKIRKIETLLKPK